MLFRASAGSEVDFLPWLTRSDFSENTWCLSQVCLKNAWSPKKTDFSKRESFFFFFFGTFQIPTPMCVVVSEILLFRALKTDERQMRNKTKQFPSRETNHEAAMVFKKPRFTFQPDLQLIGQFCCWLLTVLWLLTSWQCLIVRWQISEYGLLDSEVFYVSTCCPVNRKMLGNEPEACFLRYGMSNERTVLMRRWLACCWRATEPPVLI